MNKLKFKFSNPRFTFSSRMGKVVDNSSRAIGHPPLILSGPSGVGKSTLKDHLIQNYSKYFEFSISYTTREPRKNERHGVDYFFVEKETFQKEIDTGKFLEYNRVHDNYYGTHRNVVASIVNSGKVCLLDIDVQGVKMAMSNGLNAAYRMFIVPPNFEVLRQRLTDRGTDSKEVIDRRLAKAAKEIELAHQWNLFHVFITNDNKEDFITDSMSVIEKWYPFIKGE